MDIGTGDWSNGMTRVSKTFGGSSILSSPATDGERSLTVFIFILQQGGANVNRAATCRTFLFAKPLTEVRVYGILCL